MKERVGDSKFIIILMFSVPSRKVSYPNYPPSHAPACIAAISNIVIATTARSQTCANLLPVPLHMGSQVIVARVDFGCFPLVRDDSSGAHAVAAICLGLCTDFLSGECHNPKPVLADGAPGAL